MEFNLSKSSDFASQTPISNHRDLNMEFHEWRSSIGGTPKTDWEICTENAIEDPHKDFIVGKFPRRFSHHRNDENRRFRFKISCSSRTDIDLHQWGIDRPVPLVTIRRAICNPHRRYSLCKRLEPYHHFKYHSISNNNNNRPTALCVHSPNTFSNLAAPTLTFTSSSSSSIANRSNPGSPVKSNPFPGLSSSSPNFLQVGTPLVRSKSLDNISLCSENNNDPRFSHIPPDLLVDNMSYEISNLQLAN